MRLILAVIPVVVALNACGYVHDEKISGPYHLIAIDGFDDTDVCYEIDDGDACVGRIPAKVYAVGSNDRYVVAARHPDNDPARTEYYYLIRALDKPLADPSVSVRGPYDAGGFAVESKRLELPSLTRKLPD